MTKEKKNHNEIIEQITYDTEDNEYVYETFLKKDGMMSMTNLPLAESFIAFLNETEKNIIHTISWEAPIISSIASEQIPNSGSILKA